MITKTTLSRALLLLDKDKRATLPFACPTTPGWLWAGPWAVRSDRMEAARVEGGEVAATSAGILRDASALPDDPRNRLALRDGPRESSDGKASLYVLRNDSRLLVGMDARLWPLLEGLELWGDGPREPVAGFQDGQITALVMPGSCRKPTRTLPRRGPCPSGCGMRARRRPTRWSRITIPRRPWRRWT